MAAAAASAASVTEVAAPTPGAPAAPPPPPSCAVRRPSAASSSGGKLHLAPSTAAVLWSTSRSRLSAALSVPTKAGTRATACSRSWLVWVSICRGFQPSFSGCFTLRDWASGPTSRRRNSTSMAASLAARPGWAAKAGQVPGSSVSSSSAERDAFARSRKPRAVRFTCSSRSSRRRRSAAGCAAHASASAISSCRVCKSTSRPSASLSRKTSSFTSVSANSPNTPAASAGSEDPPAKPWSAGPRLAAAYCCMARHACGCCQSARSTPMIR
mmetsp:Transcript_6132/g.19598  ORF Transcript_6132/g.19598 Transcript_6132/m.19598 type:complete len:270 (-) Transcript_6132:920-1729(-)